MITKDQKTSSTSASPKIKLALEEKYNEENKKADEAIDKHNSIKDKEASKLPKPTGWRLLVLPYKAKEKTRGGIYLADESIERSQVASTCGLVLDMGPHCYDKEKFPEGPWCKKKDWIIFARYAGSRIQIDGGEVRLLNDDEVLATVENPEDIFHQF